MSYRIWSRHHSAAPRRGAVASPSAVPNKRSVYCLAQSRPGAGMILEQLRNAGVPAGEISLLYVLAPAARKREGASAEADTLELEVLLPGAGTRGTPAWFSPVDALRVPGCEVLMAGGPLAGSLRSGKAKSLTAGLIEFGLPTMESSRYDAGIRAGGVLIAVHDPNPEMSDDARRIFRAGGTTDGFTIMQVFPRRLLEEPSSGFRRLVVA